MKADRPATEPRTEAGRAYLAELNGDTTPPEEWRDAPGYLQRASRRAWEHDRDMILAIEAEAAQGAAPRAEGLDPLREAALRVILAQEAVRDAINGLGHPDEPHDTVLGDIGRDPTDEVQIIDTVGDCALCGGMQYGSEDTLNRAYGELRAALGLEVRPWEFPEDAARWLASRPSDERDPEEPS